MRLRRAIRDNQPPLRIEIGAWTTTRPGWIATDVNWRARYYLDATKTWPFPDRSVEFIYADNVIEHLRLPQNQVLLAEAYRVLQPGGRIRLVTPDVNALVEKYRSDIAQTADLRDQLHKEGYTIEHRVDLLRFAFHDDGHDRGYLWDEDSLRAELLRAGFRSVTVHDAGTSETPDLSNLEVRVDTPVAKICIVVEAVK